MKNEKLFHILMVLFACASCGVHPDFVLALTSAPCVSNSFATFSWPQMIQRLPIPCKFLGRTRCSCRSGDRRWRSMSEQQCCYGFIPLYRRPVLPHMIPGVALRCTSAPLSWYSRHPCSSEIRLIASPLS